MNKFWTSKRTTIPLIAATLVLLTGAVASYHIGSFQGFSEPINPPIRFSPTHILVKYKSTATENDRANTRSNIHAKLLHKYSLVANLELLDVPSGADAAISALGNNPSVAYATKDQVVHKLTSPNDTHYPATDSTNPNGQWNLNGLNTRGINAEPGWSLTTGDPSVVIADIDSGMQLDHGDLAGNLWTNPGEIAGNGVDDDNNGYVDDVHSWNFGDNNNNPTDLNGHGTHTAGIMAAVTNNSLGIAGVCWQCKIMPLRFLDASGNGYVSAAIQAIEYSVTMHVKVSNNSWGFSGFDQSLEDAITAAGNAGQLFVAAAGNNSQNSDSSPLYPAAYPNSNIISVAATDENDQLASFSNYGPTSVDLAAPGNNIYSTYINSTLTHLSGTSMAAPHVTAMAALLWSRNPSWSADQVKQKILSSVRPLTALQGLTVTGGILDAYGALHQVGDPPPPPIVDITAPLSSSVFIQGTAVTFQGSAYDYTDGNISSKISWTSTANGTTLTLGQGASLTVSSLPAGFDTIMASATNSSNLSSSSQTVVTIRNSIPVLTVSTPITGTIFKPGQSVQLSASATDQQDGTLTSKISWSSNLQGQLGTGGSLTLTNLTIGTHTITASVVDSGNLKAVTSLTVVVASTPITNLTISGITPGSVIGSGSGFLLTGSANDPTDGNISSKIIWSSNLQGQLGTGSSIAPSNLSIGTHIITASVTNSAGVTTSTVTTAVIVDATQLPPNAPSGATLVKFYSGLQVKWTDNSNNETGFQIVREVKTGSSWSAPTLVGTAPTNSTSWADNPGHGTWRYAVRAVNSAGSSSYSAWTNSIKL